MSNIRAWLKERGLHRYIDVFESEDIDLDALRRLSDDDLKELGLAMGPRRKVLAAMAETRPTDKLPDSTSPREAERRQLTVMFCDLVGSTALTEKLDPEDMRDVMRRYQDACAGAITRFGGYIAQTLGDGLLVYFGWPRAHEDDAVRAVRAALDLLDALAKVTAPETLQVRVGIHTGLVVVGEVAASDTRGADAVVGETPNVAARLQEVAEPGEVLIGAVTRRLVGAAFNLQDRGVHALKGVAQLMNVWRVVEESAVESRFEATTGTANLTPFVGREPEVNMFLDRWNQAKDGKGQVVLLQGEPGIGKSRITRELQECVADELHVCLQYQCSPYYTNSTFHPAIKQFERAANFSRDDSPEQKLDKMEAVLAAGSDDMAAVAPLIAAMLSLPADRYPPLNLTPQRQMEKTIEAIVNHIAWQAANRPVLMIFEDAHWIDPTTLETIGEVISRIENLPVFLIVTYRPELEPPWPTGGYIAACTLGRLSRQLGAELVAKVAGGKPIPAPVLDEIVAKTDGVPLFAEELTKTVLEAGYLKDAGDRYARDGLLPSLVIPSTLQDSLMARLDRLSSVKEVAQIGACIGREFGYDLLAPVSPLPDNELQDALQQLVDSELIYAHGALADATYTFKHALIQDVAYNSLLKRKRAQLHSKIALVLKRDFADRVSSSPELLATHLAAAGELAAAIPCWREAATKAFDRVALLDAIAHCESGLALISKIPESNEQLRQELAFHLLLARAAAQAKGWTAAEAERSFARARELCEQIGDAQEVLPALWGIWGWLFIAGRYLEADVISRDFLERASTSDKDTSVCEGHHMAAQTAFKLGELKRALSHVEDGIHLYNAEPDWRKTAYYGQDSGMANFGILARIHWLLGYPDQARRAQQRAMSLAQRSGKPFDITWARFYEAALYTLLRDWNTVAIASEQTIEVSARHGFAFWHSSARITLGLAEMYELKRTQAVEVVIQEQEALYATGAEGLLTWTYALLADACRGLKLDDGFDHLVKGLRLVEKNADHWYEPELHRVKGELLRSRGAEFNAQAEACFEKAMMIARHQQTKSWELRSATSLARLLRSEGRQKEACGLLAPIYSWFTEGSDTKDLQEAKALLNELAQPAYS